MTKDEVTKLLQHIAINGDTHDHRKLIMQSMTPLTQITPVAAGTRLLKEVKLAVADGKRQWLATMSTKYIVADPMLIEVAWKKAFRGELRLEPSTKIEGDDASVADGVIALLFERPVLTLVAIGADALEMRIGGFERSILAHPGNLMDLSRQVIESPARGRRRQRRRDQPEAR